MATADNENTTSTVPLKLLLDEKKTRVIAAEATSDFVDALLSFLTLPMGTIIRVTNQHTGSIGCLNNLYKSIEELSTNKFSTEASKEMLLNPPNSCTHFCKNLKLNVDDTSNGKCYFCPLCGNWSYYFNTACCCSSLFGRGRTNVEKMDVDNKKFVKSEMTFAITDDLRVLTGSLTSLVHLLHEFNISNVNQTVEISVDVGLDKVVELLKRTLLSKTPLTDVFVQRQCFVINAPIYDPCDANFLTMKNETTSDESSLSIKLIYTESDKEILVVEANESFIDLLFSLFTIPLGSLIKLLDGDTRLGCIDILYKTAVSMDPNFLGLPPIYITDCGVHEQFKCSSMLLKITSATPKHDTLLDSRNPNPSTECFGKFLKDNQLFSVSSNLEVKPASPVSSISFLKGKNVCVNDIKVKDVAIGENEVLALVKASLTSSSALDVLKIFLEDRKPQIS